MRRRFEGPWAVDDDITFAEIYARRRPDNKTLHIDTAKTQDHILTALELRQQGHDDNHIAHRLHITRDTLDKRLKRAGIDSYRSFADRRFLNTFDRIIATGKPFTTEALPIPDNNQVSANALAAAVKEGRLRKVGMHQTGKGKIGLWQGIVQAEAA